MLITHCQFLSSMKLSPALRTRLGRQRPPGSVASVHARHPLFKTPTPLYGERSLSRTQTLLDHNGCTANSSDVYVQNGQLESSATVSPWSEEEPQGSVFNWFQQWYPVAIVRDLDPKVPKAFSLLGLALVIWKDAPPAGKEEKADSALSQWRVMEDRCPHRLAPLSEGRIEESSGNLMCAYHGWQFNGEGRCASIPQLDAPSQEAACRSPRSCVSSYPCQVRHGLLWVFADSTPRGWEMSKQQPPAVCPELEDPGGSWSQLGGEWFARDLPYGWDTLMENLFDPAHIPFAHHGVMGEARRELAQPLQMTVEEDVSVQGGFRITRDSAPFRTDHPSFTDNSFVPPALYRSKSTMKSGRTLLLQFYGTPIGGGRVRLFAAFIGNFSLPAPLRALGPLTEFLGHMSQNTILDSDNYVLHVQERRLRDDLRWRTYQRWAQASMSDAADAVGSGVSGPVQSWRQAYFLPAGADVGVRLMRRWFGEAAACSVPGGPRGSNDPGPVLPREVAMERYHSHVKGCRTCSRALAASRVAEGFLLWLSAVLGAAAVVGAALASAGTSDDAPMWAAGGLALSAVLAVLRAALSRFIQNTFYFQDYVHAHK